MSQYYKAGGFKIHPPKNPVWDIHILNIMFLYPTPALISTGEHFYQYDWKMTHLNKACFQGCKESL